MLEFRKVFFLAFALLFSSTIFSQNINGIATYTSVLQSDMKIDSTKLDDAQYMQLIKMVSQPHYADFELAFSGNESVYKILPKLEKPNPSADGGMSVSVSMMSEGEILYKNLRDNIELNETEIYGKLFLVSDTLQNKNWILENESKTIGEYVCFKASSTEMVDAFMGFSDNEAQYTKEEKTTIAWYTPQIPIKNGPASFSGLPGLILELKDGELTYLCTKIIINPIEPIIIEAPKKGKKITKKDFKEMLKKKFREQMENFQNTNISRD